MKITVITINRNNSVGLVRTLISISAQTYKEFEYIIVDGASTDDSVDVIKRFNSDGLASFKWVSEPDSGIYNAMNKGVGMASGDYLLFINSGDILTNSNVISELLSVEVSSDIVIGQINFTSSEGIRYCDYQTKCETLSLYSFLGIMIPHQATLVKRDTFLKLGGYYEKYRIVADWQYCLRAIINNNCSYEFIPVTIATFDNSGISTCQGDKMMKEIEIALKDTIPERIFCDYAWAQNHRGDINRLTWLLEHKCFYKIFRWMVAIGRRIS